MKKSELKLLVEEVLKEYTDDPCIQVEENLADALDELETVLKWTDNKEYKQVAGKSFHNKISGQLKKSIKELEAVYRETSKLSTIK